MLCIKKRIETPRGLYRIGAVVLNEEETWKDDNVKPICSDNDFMLRFIPAGKKGSFAGKKHFRSIEEAETYIYFIDINGFSTLDL